MLTTQPRREKVILPMPCTVRTFSEASGVSAGAVCKALMDLGVMVNINAQIDNEMARLLAEQFGVQITMKQAESPEERWSVGLPSMAAQSCDSRRLAISKFAGLSASRDAPLFRAARKHAAQLDSGDDEHGESREDDPHDPCEFLHFPPGP